VAVVVVCFYKQKKLLVWALLGYCIDNIYKKKYGSISTSDNGVVVSVYKLGVGGGVDTELSNC